MKTSPEQSFVLVVLSELMVQMTKNLLAEKSDRGQKGEALVDILTI